MRQWAAGSWMAIVALGLAGCGSDEIAAPAASVETVPATASVESSSAGSSSESSTDGATTTVATTAPATTAPATTASPAPSTSVVPTTLAVVPIVGVYETVVFYPACGNETLDHDGVTWYPIVHVGYEPTSESLQPIVDAVAAVEREPSPVVGLNGLRVVAPGPGDDVGTLVVWADGVARWVSDSKQLDVWMVDDEITYNWAC